MNQTPSKDETRGDGDGGAEGGDVFIFPLSYAQERMWFIYKLHPALYTMQLISLRLEGPLDATALQRALDEMIRRHEILRTSFPEVDGRPVQRVVPSLEVPIALYDLGSLPAPEREVEARRLAEQASREIFNLVSLPLVRPVLIRLGETDHVLVVLTHHILADGWSLRIFHEELAALYEASCEGRPPSLPELPVQYADYAIWERERLESGAFKDQLDYWRRQLGGAPGPLRLLSDREPPEAPSYAGIKQYFQLSPALSEAIQTLGRAEGVTLYAILLATFKLLLHRYSGQSDLAVGTVTANRNRVELERLIGFFVNTLVLRTDASGDPTFREFLRRVREVTLSAFANQDIPYDCVVDDLRPERSLGQNPLFQIAFSRQEAPPAAVRLHRLSSADFHVQGDFTRFDLELHVFDTPGGVQGLCVYSSALFDHGTIERMLGHYQELLRSIVAAPGARLSELAMLTLEERARLLPARARPGARPPRELAVHRRVEEQAERAPDTIAFQYGEEALTYRELDERANRLAHHLLQRGVAHGSLVGVSIARGPELAVACLAVLKARSAFALLDPADPPAYRARQLERVHLGAVLTASQPTEPSRGVGVVVDMKLERAAISEHPRSRPDVDVDPSSRACAWLSSARGASLDHHAVSAHIEDMQRRFELSSADALLWHGPLGRDAAPWELLWPLAFGARVVAMRPDASLRDLAGLITVIRCSPPELALLIKAVEEDASVASTAALRQVLCHGEPLRADLIRRFHASFSCKLHVVYGRPEAGPVVAAHACTAAEVGEVAPLGTPGPDAVVLILDERRRLCPVGLTGDIYVGGQGLSREEGFDRLENEARFVEVSLEDGRTMRLLRTGERGRWTPRGELSVRGGVATSCRVGGRCVDHAEIEATLLEQPSVHACAVLVRDESGHGQRLVAYVVADEEDAAPLASAMRARLPAEMLPHAYVLVSSLPLSPAGHVDIAALARLPVVDEALAARWEQRLRATPEIAEAAVLVRSAADEAPLLHLSDLLPASAPPPSRGEPRSRGRDPSGSAREGGVPALVTPEPLPEGGSVRVLGDLLERAAAEAGQRGITFIEADGAESRHSYAELLDRARRISGALRDAGLRPEDKVLLQLARNQDFLPAFWGCVLAGVVPVPLAVAARYEPGNAAAAKLINAWKLLDRPLIIAGPAVEAPVRALGRELGIEGFRVEPLTHLLAHPPDARAHKPREEDLALLLLTSGSTGLPKAVMQTHRMIVRRSMAATHQLALTRDDVSLNWMPLDHVGGLVMSHARDAFLGCDQVHVHTEPVLEDPLRWLDWLDRFRCTNTWAPNFAFALINDRAGEIAKRTWDLSCVRMILNGGESIIPRSARRFLELLAPHGLPSSAIYPGWGMTETTSGVVHSSRFTLETTDDDDPFVDIGPPVPGVALRIVNASNEVVDEGTSGHLQVRGETVTPGYFARPELNREIFTDDGWFSTGDLAFLRDGRLTITGRAKDEIIINGLNYFPHEIESVVELVPGVEASSAAACGVRGSESQTDILAIFFSIARDDDEGLREALQSIRRAVVGDIGLNPSLLIPIPRDALPRTGIGKIRRADLKSKLEDGEFQSILKRVEILLGTSNVIPPWFYKRRWRRKEPALRAASLASGAEATAIFLDRLGLGAAAADRLRGAGRTCVTVAQGEGFARVDRTSYVLRPGDEGDYRRLMSCLGDDGVRLGHVLHLFTYDGRPREVTTIEALREAQGHGVLSVLFLVQSLHRAQGAAGPVRLDVVSSAVQPAGSDEPLACEASTLLGLLRTLALEMSWIHARHVDLDPVDLDANTGSLLDELRVLDREPEVAYRGGRRLVPALSPMDLLAEPPHELPFKRGALFLLTGGLGGLGAHVAKALLEQFGVRLLIVGRTALPPQDLQDDLSPGDVRLAKRVRAHRMLESCGSIMYSAAHVEDLPALERAVAEAQARWSCPLSGVLHLAGEGSLEVHWRTMDEHRVASAHPDSFEQMFAPKVYGTWTLLQLLKRHPEAALIAFSSVNSLFGAPTLGAYSAANSFVDSSVVRERRAGRRAWCFNFTMWDNVGMSEGGQAFANGASEAMGYHVISPREGVGSLLVGLARSEPQVIVGLSGSGRAPWRGAMTSSSPRQELAAFVVPRDEAVSARTLADLRMSDRFGVPSACAVVTLESLPRTTDGSADRAALLDLDSRRGSGPSAYVQPETDFERGLAAIWQQVLGVERASVDDNFFDLGGNSLLTIRVKSLVEASFHIELSVVDMFKYPTIRSLAEHMSNPQHEIVLDEGHDRAEARKKAFERRRGAKRS